MPRRARKVLSLASILALMCFPSVRDWYVHQAMVHGKHIANEIVSNLDTTHPSPRQIR